MEEPATPHLPPTLLKVASKVAQARRTTVSAILRQSLGEFLYPGRETAELDPLLAYSLGKIDRHQAIERLGCRDYAELLVALGDNDLSMPLPDPDEIERQAQTLSKLWHGDDG